MVITRRTRDRIVEAGELARTGATHRPWVYGFRVKSGCRKTRVVEGTYYNRIDLFADAVRRFARDNEHFFIFGVTRVMRSALKSNREDL